MTANGPRVMLLGFDAIDPVLVREWSKAGILPAFRSLFERSSFGPTENPPGLFVGAVWPSFFTGTSPTRHGRYCFEQFVSGTYDVRRFMSSDLQRSPFWTVLSSAGRRVAVVDVPKSPLATNLNGIQLCDWTTHDPEPGAQLRAWPPSLAADVAARFGVDPVGDCNDIKRDVDGFETFRRNLRARIEMKTALCREILDRERWDLFLAVFAESHCVGHQAWAVHDPAHVAHDRNLAQAIGDPLRDVYVALDRAVGELLQRAGDDTVVFVLASHGMGAHYDANFMLDEILQRLDPQPGVWKQTALTWARRIGRALERRMRPGTWPPVRLAVAQRRFFAVPNNDVYGAIRVNLAGREPNGCVRPGAELDALSSHLRSELLALVNVDNGEPVVRDVFRLADRYPGENTTEMPDFCVEWNRRWPISTVRSPRIGTLSKRFRGVRSGDHTPAGFFWCSGPNIRAGERADPVSVMDFAATVAARLDVPLPDIDGRPIAGVAG